MARQRAVRKVHLDIELEFARCRGLYKHAWEDYQLPASDRRRTRFGWRKARICTRCGTTSVTCFNHLGQKEPWSYKYPDGYSYTADEAPSQEELNLFLLGAEGAGEYFGDRLVERRVKKRKPAAKKAVAKKAQPRKAPAKKATPRSRHLRAVS